MRRRAQHGTCWLIGLSMLAASISAEQQPPQAPPLFRSNTRLIVENVVVKDKSGNAIEGLTAQDFVVTEDGEPQAIAFVEFQRLAPVSASAPNGASADKPAPAAPLAPVAALAPEQTQISPSPPGAIRYGGRRLLVLYFDMTAMPPADQLRALTAAQKFIRTQMTSAERRNSQRMPTA